MSVSKGNEGLSAMSKFGKLRFKQIDKPGKVMVHKSFPYALCIRTSQPLDFIQIQNISRG